MSIRRSQSIDPRTSSGVEMLEGRVSAEKVGILLMAVYGRDSLASENAPRMMIRSFLLR